ncbi:ABC transporter permease [[Mycoplasma] testudinis]|uniref:ABC transporter permease n=1 Tax=[Mycoplasma] testudinis TaxID=33924 RepID=UPI000697659C|nr:ABC transporter permease [[Mycoplasma] testudinis]
MSKFNGPFLKSLLKNNTIGFYDKYFYRAPQKSLRRKFISVVFFILVAVMLSYFITVWLGSRPASFGFMFSRLFESGAANVQNFIYQIAIFTVAGLAFSFCMNVGIFNIGISGQMMAGASTAFLLINVFPSDWKTIAGGGQIVTLIFSIIGATFVATLVGLFKVYLKVNEVVSAILLNWIILFMVAYLVRTPETQLLDNAANNNGFFRAIQLPAGYTFFQPGLGFNNNSGWVWSIAVTVVLVIIIWAVMKFTVFGHKLKTTGTSPTAAQYFGYNYKNLQLASFAISGIIAGVLGVIVYTGTSNSLNFDAIGGTQLNQVPAEGFNGIAIGLIALNNPIGIFVVSILFAAVNAGAAQAGLPVTTISLITGIMMYIIAIYGLASYLRPWRWFYLLKYRKANSENYLNYENHMSAAAEKRTFKIADMRASLVRTKTDMMLKNLDPKFRKFIISFLLTPIYKLVLIRFSKQYHLLKHAINVEYMKERNEIHEELKMSCAYSLVIDWEQKIEFSQISNVMPRLSFWKKDKVLVEKWKIAAHDDEIIKQIEKHVNRVEQWFVTNTPKLPGGLI